MVKMVICKDCGRNKVHCAKGFCHSCYSKNLQKHNLKICTECGKLKPHKAHGLCNTCYINKNKNFCKKCGLYKPIVSKGLCNVCYRKIINNCKTLKQYHEKTKNNPDSLTIEFMQEMIGIECK